MDHDRKDQEEQASGDLSWRQATLVAGLALSLPAMMFGPPAVGYYIDEYFGTSPWFFLSFLAIGFLGTAINVYQLLKKSKVIS